MPNPTTPADLLALPAMNPTDFLNATRVQLALPNAYLVIDVEKSTADDLWVATPMEDAWFALPTARVQTIAPLRFGKEMNPRRILCEFVFSY